MSAAPLPRPSRPTTGFVQDPRNAFEHWPRLLAGETQWSLLKFIQHEQNFKGESRWTAPLNNETIAGYCRCTVRAVEMTLRELLDRKVLLRKKVVGGFAYAIPFETWPGLPDRPPKVVPIVSPEVEPAPEDDTPEDDRPRGEAIPVYEKRQKARAGGNSRPVEFKGAIPGKLQVRSSFPFEYDAYIQGGTLVFMALEVEQKGKREYKAKTKHGSLLEQQLPPNQQKPALSNFHLFETVWLTHRINAAPDDWAASRAVWSRMDTAEQIAAVKGVEERFYLGEYDPKEPKWIPLPQNYLQKKLWMRPIRGKPAAGKVKVFADEATVLAAHDWARAKDREIAARKK